MLSLCLLPQRSEIALQPSVVGKGLEPRRSSFEATRKARTERIQQTSRANTWLSGKTDTDWVYSYDAWTVPLAA